MSRAATHGRRPDDSYELTHGKIKEATLQTIARLGLSDTTIQKIAEAADVSTATIIKHFETKENVLQAALETIAQEFNEGRAQVLRDSKGDPVRYLLLTIDLVFHPAISNASRIAVWNAFWGEAQARKLYQKVIGAIEVDYEATVIEMCRQIAKNGGYNNVNAEAVAVSFIGLMDWLWQEKLIKGDSFNFKRARRLALAHLANCFPRHFSH
jgi:TetR/AcrR family transcriptional repressor of bet genes